jgi:cytochrome c oxidase cbb3-type subunit III
MQRLLRSAESLMQTAKRIGASLVLFAAVLAPTVALAQGRGAGESPASQKPPATKQAQTYPPEQIQAGETRFVSQCGFCHGRDAAGGEAGPDLTRSVLVAEDVRGDKIGPVIRQGRPDKGMPASNLSDTDIAAMVAFIHDAKAKAESAGGGRRSVDVADLQTGNADAGRRYFNGAGGCAKCHSLSGDFAKVGARYEGLALLHRLLYPGSGRGAGPAPAPPTATVTTPDGKVIIGKVVQHDEFTISLTDANGWRRSWPVKDVRIKIDNPLQAHVDQLGKYTDEDMHNVFAYLQTLK